MTGFGKAEIQFENKNYILELRSLNSKGLELNARMPGQYREIEIQLKKIIGEALKRGKIDLNLNVEDIQQSNAKIINVAAVNQYIDQLGKIQEADRLELLKIAIKLPDTLKTCPRKHGIKTISTFSSVFTSLRTRCIFFFHVRARSKPPWM